MKKLSDTVTNKGLVVLGTLVAFGAIGYSFGKPGERMILTGAGAFVGLLLYKPIVSIFVDVKKPVSLK